MKYQIMNTASNILAIITIGFLMATLVFAEIGVIVLLVNIAKGQ